MTDRRIRHLPVLSDGKLMGIISHQPARVEYHRHGGPA
ncbi:MAG: hypothetical protein AAF961_01395 [Planctomycetota bacterium]